MGFEDWVAAAVGVAAISLGGAMVWNRRKLARLNADALRAFFGGLVRKRYETLAREDEAVGRPTPFEAGTALGPRFVLVIGVGCLVVAAAFFTVALMGPTSEAEMAGWR